MMDNRVDVIVVGAGLAGIYTALNLPSHLHIALLSAHEDNSSLAQGGIASCIKKEDSFNAHIEDTLNAGHYTNDPFAVKQLVEAGPMHIESLQRFGVEFDITDNQIAATLEGGHSNPRVLHINGDQTGKGIMDVLKHAVATRSNIDIYYNCHAIELLKDDTGQAITGLIYEQNGVLSTLLSSHVVLATGGMGSLYPFTTNHVGSYGTGIALAIEAGAKTKDLHLMQFHPTAFYSEKNNRFFLISEALRGEGAYLLNDNYERFMLAIDNRAELAPRDIVSKAIYEQLSHSTKSYVYLDTTHLGVEKMKQRFPSISAHLLKCGYTLGNDLIPVTPVAHYTVGGIEVDYNGMSSIDGLYACGEVASTGVHGANRLASNSLLECLVYGKAVADAIAEELTFDKTVDDRLVSWPKCTNSHMSVNPIAKNDIIASIQSTMQKYVGIKRTNKGLLYAKKTIHQLRKQLEHSRYHHIEKYLAYQMTTVALQSIEDALSHDSLGCHYKVDAREEQKIC